MQRKSLSSGDENKQGKEKEGRGGAVGMAADV